MLLVEVCTPNVIISFCCQESFHWKHNEGKIISLISTVVYYDSFHSVVETFALKDGLFNNDCISLNDHPFSRPK